MHNHWHLMDSRHRTLFIFRTADALADYIRLEHWDPAKLAAKRCALVDDVCHRVNRVYTLSEEEQTALVIPRFTHLKGLIEGREEIQAPQELAASYV